MSLILLRNASILDQVSYRGRNDDGSETTATWKAAQNTGWTQDTDVNFRIRFEIQNTEARPEETGFRLQYNLASGGWNNVTAASSVARAVASSQIADGVATTDQLAAGTGTFVANSIDEVDGVTAASALVASGHTEVEFVLKLMPADVTAAQTIQFRVVKNDGVTVLPTYTATPTVTIAKPTRNTGTARLSLTSLTTPGAGTQTLKVRARIASGSGQLRVQLYEGGTQRGTADHSLTGSFADYSLNPSGITDYSNLEVRIQGLGTAGWQFTPEVSWVQFNVPISSGTSVTTTRDLRIQGQNVSDAPRNLRLTGHAIDEVNRALRVQGQATDTVIRNLRIVSQLDSDTTRSLRVVGTVADSVTRNISIQGQADSAAIRDIRVQGQLDSSSFRDLRVTGQLVASQDRSVRIVGQADESTTRNLRIQGQLSDSKTQDLRVQGELTNDVTRALRIWGSTPTVESTTLDLRLVGQDTSADTRNVRIVGQLDQSTTRDLRVQGEQTLTVTRDLRIQGQLDNSVIRDLRVQGQLDQSETRNLRVQGQETSDVVRNLRIEGNPADAQATVERDLRITGQLDQSVTRDV
jgi:hypothetical protein